MSGYAPAIERELPTDDAHDLIELTREIVARELLPRVAEAERSADFPRDVFSLLGETGLLSLPYPEEIGGGGQSATVYLQVLEELARGWLAVALGTSVHVLSCHGVATVGTSEQQQQWLPEMLGGSTLGAFCLSEPQAGSDVAALRSRAEPTGSGYRLTGQKAWITHGPVADFYLVFARTADTGSKGLSAFHLPAGSPGIHAAAPEKKMGLRSSVTSPVAFDQVELPADALLGNEGDGMSIALSALDAGRLGMAACAVGVAQAALDAAVEYTGARTAFGRSIAEFQGVGFLLADAAAGIEAARQLYLYAARLKDADRSFTQAAAKAKLVATDTAMRVATDMVQVFGGAGYVEDHPVERFMREAKVLQIVEGTNQIQRLVISRGLARGAR